MNYTHDRELSFIGIFLKRYREALRKDDGGCPSPKEFRKMLGLKVSLTLYRRIEAGDVAAIGKMKSSDILAIADTLRVPTKFLLGERPVSEEK